METEMIIHYEAPQVEVIEVEVEKGFANSNDPAETLGNGGTWYPG